MDCSTDQNTSALLKSRSSRVHKPNSFIFSSDNVVRMPQKKHIKTNSILNNAIKTINKTKLNHDLRKTNLTNFKEKINGYNYTKNRINGSTKSRKPIVKSELIKRCYPKRKLKLNPKYTKYESDQLTNTSSSSEDTESNSIPNENKNLINLSNNKINHTLNHLFTKQPITKNGKIRGRPRKPVEIEGLLGILGSGKKLANGKNGNGDQHNNFKNLLEKIHESHQNQLNKLRKEIEDKEQERIVTEVKNASLKKEIEMLRSRINSLINESELSKELESIKEQHNEEISKIKKKLWCSNKDCEEQATYFCCLNAFYCSLDCQNEHWYSTHRKCCRNKNRLSNSTQQLNHSTSSMKYR